MLPCVGRSQSRKPPNLVVLISVDQMMPEYFDRFGPQLNGGLKKLYTQGIVFDSCTLGYAFTETGPGHATLVTGSYPRRHGIFLNEWFDQESRKMVYCVQDSQAAPVEGLGGYRSPANLRLTAIGDWLKAEHPRSRVVSISVKDRSAVLMGGQHPDVVAWYSAASGKFVSSSYYGTKLPQFIRRVNESGFLRKIPNSWGKTATGCDPSTSPDSMQGESTWPGNSASFPHTIQEAEKPGVLPFTPFGDSLILSLGKDCIREMKLGGGDQTELLCLGLSSTDYIGHLYGPNSVEMCEQISRLDRYLGDFLSALDNSVGAEKCLVILTSDHGIPPLPEYSTKYLGKPVRRVILEDEYKQTLARVDSELKGRLHVNESLIPNDGFLSYEVAHEAGYSADKFEETVREELRKVDFVSDIFFRKELLGDESSDDRPHQDEFRKDYDPERGPDFVIVPGDNFLLTERKYPDHHGVFCGHVPLIFWSTQLQPKKVARPVRSVDIAPTIAEFLGLDIPASIDGKALEEVP
jgi:predicted AlkP superfamily pyrophosphatase or phosphodiesterase